MGKGELARILASLQTARAGANFAGKFTEKIRIETMRHRYETIYVPLDAAIDALKKELDRLNKPPQNRRKLTRAYRAPYKD